MRQTLYSKLSEIGKRYTILYVEDDEGIARVMSSVLGLFCHTLHHAKNGQEGLACYESLSPDLIITDISMPVMDGITMVKAIREKDKEIPIMINSAFSDQSYLLESIYLGVNRYTVKPIRQDEFLEALQSLFLTLHERDQARLFAKIQLQEKVNKASTTMLTTLMEFYPLPTLIYTEDGRLYGLNTQASTLFDIPSTQEANLYEKVTTTFIKEEGFVWDLQSVDAQMSPLQKVKIRTQQGKKIFTVLKKAIHSEEFGPLFLYAFNDITRLEYEKQKSQNLFRYFQEMAHFKYARKQPNSAYTHQELLHVTPASEPSYEHIRLHAMHYADKTSAKEYLKEILESLVEELAEMDEIEEELREALNHFELTPDIHSLHTIAQGIAQYAKTIGSLITFEDLAFSLHKLCDLLFSLQSLPENRRKLHLLLDGVISDLKQWRKQIFLTQEATDIHYLDASLLSSCLQIEAEFFSTTPLESSELDLF